MVETRARRGRWVVIAALVLATTGVGALLAKKRVDAAPEEDRVRRKPIVQSVVASGRVIAPSRVVVGSIVLGTVERVMVREGDRVRAGAILASLKADEQRAALAQARYLLVEAEARIRQLETLAAPVAEQALSQAGASLEFARQEHDRVRKLVEGGFYGRARMDEADRNLEVAEAQVRTAQAQLAANRRGSELQLALARRDQAQAALEVAAVRLANTNIVAPSDGRILKRMVEAGDAVPAGKTLFEMSTGGDPQILLLVDEKNLALLAEGQQARVAADAYPGLPLDARIFFISPAVDLARGTVEVKLKPSSLPEFLRHDMTVSGEIVVARRESALVVPSAAVREPRGPDPFVMVPDGGTSVRRSVRIGITGTGDTEVLAGLAEGDRVVMPKGSGTPADKAIPLGPR